MSCQILYDEKREVAAFYCTTTDHAFGPIINAAGDLDAYEVASGFIKWYGDPRRSNLSELDHYIPAYVSLKPRECVGSFSRCCLTYAVPMDFYGEENNAYEDGFCSEQCRLEYCEDQGIA